MKIGRVREPSGLIVTRFGRRHTYNDAVDALDEWVEMTVDESEIYEIVIHEDDFEIHVSQQKVELLREKVKATFAGYQQGALAFVANSDLVFGLCRQLELMMQTEAIAVSVFRKEELAREWIEGIQSNLCTEL